MNSLWHSLAALVFLSVLHSTAQEWTRFRGPNGSGISIAKTIPTKWTEADFNWKTALPGAGHSSPVVWGDKVFVMSGDDQTRQVWVLCVSASNGQVLWQKAGPFTPHHKNSYNTFASSSPAVDATRVYACWSSPDSFRLIALTHGGEKIWERDLGAFASQHGGGVSPIVYEDKVILPNEQDGASFLIAVEAATGKTVWQTPRRTNETAYATPCVYEPKDGAPTLIFESHAHGVSAIAPGSGKMLWDMPELFDKRVVSSAVLAAGLIIGTCGSGGGGNYLVAVRPGSASGENKPAVAYTIRKSAPYVPTSVCVGNRLFLWGDTGTVSCVDAASGEVKWQEHVGGNYFSSPVWIDGRLFGIATKGEVVVLEASDRFQVLARNPLGRRRTARRQWREGACIFTPLTTWSVLVDGSSPGPRTSSIWPHWAGRHRIPEKRSAQSPCCQYWRGCRRLVSQ
jgi:outer membrane protein assembly factor BamB